MATAARASPEGNRRRREWHGAAAHREAKECFAAQSSADLASQDGVRRSSGRVSSTTTKQNKKSCEEAKQAKQLVAYLSSTLLLRYPID